MEFTMITMPLIVFLVFVAPIWIFTHYATRWRTSKMLSADDEKMLAELWESAARMDSRINSLERILDAEVPEWRKQV
jgi:phage shock protein B